jgi:hypothetical protein
MNPNQRAFLPERLRPTKQRPRRRVRRRRPLLLLVAAVVTVGLVAGLAPRWSYRSVDVSGCGALPPEAQMALTDLTGVWIGAVDLEWVRSFAQRWPSVGAVSVRLHLPGDLVIVTAPAVVCGSTPAAGGWQAVGCDGSLGPRLTGPEAPVLTDFAIEGRSLRRGLVVGQRLGDAANARVTGVRQITPEDYEVHVMAAVGDGRFTVRVGQEPAAAERWWIREVTRGTPPRWADLRRDDRVVVGDVG